MARPFTMSLELGSYLLRRRKWPKKGKLFPIVLMLEPLPACNLHCAGCGRVREYAEVMQKRMTVDEALTAAEKAGAPVVSLSGGEPLLHPQIDELVAGLLDQRRWIYLCTNGLLLRRSLDKFTPNKRLCFVVHLDGTEKVHDSITARPGTFKEALAGLTEARRRGFRGATNTTVFHSSDVEDLRRLFRLLTDLGIEGLMLSPGYAYEAVPEKELFLRKEESVQVFRKIISRQNGFRFYDNPLFLAFLRGEREYRECAAWAIPTYTVLGWRVPCYLIADRHTSELQEVFDPKLWEKYGPGKDRRCAGCMLHAGFEPQSVLEAVNRPWLLLRR